ncbi:helix-turn-helix domain-containing protein [Amycolatopsis anabasis]|uniref:helix-turn-helix domain-containing protein n=1 Tax=Amycolatopsis anabasis TaxID=1840409 RepID=UPI00131E09E7|nr:helix-turn-helix transcriptional regulator [Amycolatopsis anabasis]
MEVTFSADIARRVLIYRLQQLVAEKPVSQGVIAEALGMTRTGVTKLLNGTNLPSKPALKVLAQDVFHISQKELADLQDLLATAKLKPKTKGGPPPTRTKDDFTLFIGLEARTTHIEKFEMAVVTGLLQTDDYARRIISYHASLTAGIDIEQALEVRHARQAGILRDESPTELWFICEEQALRRPIGGSKVMVKQLDHLLAMAERPNVTFQVIPQTVDVHPGLSGSFTLLRFEDDRRVVYEETMKSAYYYGQARDVEEYERSMNHLRHCALKPKQSRDLALTIRKEFHQER